ncbi:3'-5' exoribonuclease HELZ2-like [Oncorhynchus nerka]|uniref:3'-5' exoribonuclease HELZ2-like n=1 Tax=Oncorhynchus nerka TaxID=8023 RepID=UPI001130E78D|nr:helicase with zinc finger domain 2-like [Oncorhynchus nerka]
MSGAQSWFITWQKIRGRKSTIRSGLFLQSSLSSTATISSKVCPVGTAPASPNYCTARCNWLYGEHCASLGHSQMISGDTTTEWKHRPPPHSHKAEFWFCDRPDTCEYGTNCVKAHSVEELEEWLMRAEEDKVMRRNIKAQGLMSYREQLLEEYRQSSNEVQIISEQVDDVRVTFDGDLCVECVETDAEFKWNFQIKTERLLAHVALLKQEPGASFSLDENSPGTLASGEQGHHPMHGQDRSTGRASEGVQAPSD